MKHDLDEVERYINRGSSMQEVADKGQYIYVLVQAMTGVAIAATRNGWSTPRHAQWEKWWANISTEEEYKRGST